MKKILIFSVAYHPFVGGAEIAVKEITDRLSPKALAGAAEFQFEMITLNLDGAQQKEEQIGNILVHRIGGPGRISKLLFPFSAFLLAKRLHREKTFDSIWSIMASFGGFAALFFKFANPKVPFILTLQEGDPIPDIKRQVQLVYPLFRRIFTKADAIQAISNYLADFARDMGATCPIQVVPNGVDVALFSTRPRQENIDAAGEEMGKQPGDTMLITTSRLVPKNAVGDIIAALALLPDNTRLTVIGEGPLGEVLEAQANYLGVSERVAFLGFKPYEEIPVYLAASDIFIRPSLSEGMGNSFIEAMAAGIPVIATPVGGIPDFLHDSETGLFCEVNNPKSIADCVSRLVDNGELREAIISNSRKLTIDRYDWSMISKEMKGVLMIDAKAHEQPAI